MLRATAGDPFRAWAAIDPEALWEQAALLDAAGPGPERPLFGLAVAVKDNLDTVDLPTGYGSAIYAGHRPSVDAGVVGRLRRAGALIAGKTKCAEFAWVTAPDTLNPLDMTRTPGGSSNGSAAAVAAGQVRVALGTQTAGSINRPASYCAVVGYKPSFGAIPRDGLRVIAPTLDTIGLLGASVSDVRLVAGALGVGSGAGSAGRRPRVGFLRTPHWDRLAPPVRAALEQTARTLGAEEVELGPEYGALHDAQETIQLVESARSLAGEPRDRLSPALAELIDTGLAISDARYRLALDVAVARAGDLLARLSHLDAWLTPSTDGVPPVGLAFTGSPRFCRVWTLIGAPSVSLPLAWQGPLPLGLQLVAAPGRDGEVLDLADRLAAFGKTVRP